LSGWTRLAIVVFLVLVSILHRLRCCSSGLLRDGISLYVWHGRGSCIRRSYIICPTLIVSGFCIVYHWCTQAFEQLVQLIAGLHPRSLCRERVENTLELRLHAKT
jgi:hypothetical protein